MGYSFGSIADVRTRNNMNIWGISALYHDSAAALLRDGDILAAAQEERFSRKKHDARFPSHTVEYCLSEAGTTVRELDYIVFYDKPLVKFERLLETYLADAPKGFRSFTIVLTQGSAVAPFIYTLF